MLRSSAAYPSGHLWSNKKFGHNSAFHVNMHSFAGFIMKSGKVNIYFLKNLSSFSERSYLHLTDSNSWI